MKTDGLLWIIIIELGILLYALYSASQTVSSDVTAAESNPLTALLSKI